VFAWTSGQQPPDPGGTTHNNALRGVAVLSPCNAWAVGEYDPEQTLIVHCDGKSWTRVPSPDPADPTLPQILYGVAGFSAQDAWAVGNYFTGAFEKSMILHWNGSSWKQVTSPNPGSQGTFLFGVRATSASNAWAVGAAYNGTAEQTLALHCC
jgi:hypothetical protein